MDMYQKDDLMSHKELVMIMNTNEFVKERKQMELEEHEQHHLYEHTTERLVRMEMALNTFSV
jgi:hypothetical protein